MADIEAPVATRPRYHHGDLRAAMIRATVQMVTELGSEAVSVREVARRAGVSSGAPFHHFLSRQALMTAVAEEANYRLRRCIEEAAADVPDGKPARRLRAIGRAYLRWVVDNPAQFRVVSDTRLIDHAEPIRRDNQAIQALLRESLRRAIKSDGKHAVDVDQAVLELRAIVYGLARLFVDGHLWQWGMNETDPLERLQTALDDSLARLIAR